MKILVTQSHQPERVHSHMWPAAAILVGADAEHSDHVEKFH